MPTTFTATPDAIVSGGAVAITEPVDGDLASAASILASIEKLADIVKKLVNQAPMFGVTPSILNTNSPNGLLFASEADALGARMRTYARLEGGAIKDFVVVYNASWDGTHWNRDTNLADAIMQTTTIQFFTVGMVAVGRFDTTTAAQWTDSGWDLAGLTYSGAAQGAGLGVMSMEAVHTLTYSGTWVDSGAPLEGVRYWKDPFGMVHLSGACKNASSGNLAIGTLPAGYRPGVVRAFNSTNTLGVEIDTAGVVTAVSYSGSSVSVILDGISFR